jgi:3'-phosphoadenosine 5'-phosphosulfate sulfotransferase
MHRGKSHIKQLVDFLGGDRRAVLVHDVTREQFLRVVNGGRVFLLLRSRLLDLAARRLANIEREGFIAFYNFAGMNNRLEHLKLLGLERP